MKIGMLCPAPIRGSGGLRTICHYAQALKRAGMEAHVIIVDEVDQLAARADIEAYYGLIDITVIRFPCDFSQYDALVATRWDTARIVRDSGVPAQLYLVQDFEAYFNPMGDGYLEGENSYLYRLDAITLGKWLNVKLEWEFGNQARSIDFGVDNEIYRLDRLPLDRSNTICAIVQPEKPRRCTRLAIEALGIVKALEPAVEIKLFGGEKTELWFPAEQLGIISTKELAGLYNSSSVGLCISSSNPSRIPFEMMACGLPVVDLYRSNNLYDLPDSGCLLAHQTPESIAEALLLALRDFELRDALSVGGVEFMRARTFRKEADDFAAAVKDVLEGAHKPIARKQFKPLYARPPVVAPVYNRKDVLSHCAFQLGLYSQSPNSELSDV